VLFTAVNWLVYFLAIERAFAIKRKLSHKLNSRTEG